MPRAQLGLPLNLEIFLKIMISLEFHGISLDIKILEMFMNSLGKLLSSGTFVTTRNDSIPSWKRTSVTT